MCPGGPTVASLTLVCPPKNRALLWPRPQATGQAVLECEEHEKRVWSVDFCHQAPGLLLSGSDDCRVKAACPLPLRSIS